jgi:putative protease
LRAAVANGADAVYFGLNHGHNARARATNFSLATLPQTMAYLHRAGVRGYVTLNTLAFSDELSGLEQTLRAVAAAGVDAILVQDLGVARLARALCPQLELHASTQMSLTSAECIEAIASLGISRVVLPRELSIKEINRIHQHTTMSLEAFVHGALCVAYSGQCLTSESLGGRSANRGQCAQACRMPYELFCDGEHIDLGEQKYLLSPQDLAAFPLLPELLVAGVTSFKIEGRLKTPEYVANITHHYRQALDEALAGRRKQFTPHEVEEMELSFSRGFSPGWLLGNHHKRLVPGLSSAKRGVLLGRVVQIRGGRVAVQLAASIKPGDGVVFAGDRASGQETGGRVYEVFQRGERQTEAIHHGTVELAFAHGAIDFSLLWAGQPIWKTDDPQLTSRWRKTYAGGKLPQRVPVDLHITARVGHPLVVRATTASGVEVQIVSDEPLAAATKHAATVELFKKQLGRLGDTPFFLRNVEAEIVDGPMTPLSVLGKLRHQLVDRLEAACTAAPTQNLPTHEILAELRGGLWGPTIDTVTDASANQPAQLWVLCRSLDQLMAVMPAGVAGVYADFQDIRQYRQAVQMARAAGVPLYLATPRIHKPGETGIFHAMLRHAPDGVLARNLAALQFFNSHGIPTVADFSLNVTNELSAAWLRQQGAHRVATSYDMNRDQLLGLVDALPASWWEVVVHQHMPMFHMEHCVFCAVLSPGTDKTNCGRPCDVHQVQLRDRIGMDHPLKADVGCRNTLFNATPQSAAEVVPTLLARGVRHLRVELLDGLADDDAPARIITLYQQLLRGEIAPSQVWQQLQAMNRVGVTRGTLETKRDPLAIL